MAPKAVDALIHLGRNSRFRGHGSHLWIVLDQSLWPTERFVPESCAGPTPRRRR